nr:MAG TPA: tail protein [Caudoviricetes sp.]
MAILSTAKVVGMLSSAKKTGRQVMNAAGEWVVEVVEDFMSGFAGHGWKIWEYVKGKWMLEIDSIRVREQFIVFEMLVSKMRAIIGSLGISQACGKIATVTLSEDGAEYLITLEDETMSFVAHDFMRCQTYTGTKQTFYHVEISSVVDDIIHIPVSEFDKDEEGNVINPPKVGNDIVQFGNSVNKNRQSAIYIHADESGQPAIDIMFDIDSKDWTGKVKTRLGGDIPGGGGTRGFYCENGMIKGTDTSGHTVYCIHPDGTAEFGDGSTKFAADRSGKLAGGAISWEWDADKKKYVCTMGDVILSWDNLSPEVKENLKGADGKDAVLFQIEFYMNGTRINDIPCDIHGVPISGNTVIAKLYRISGNTKEDYTPEKWRISYLKEGVEVLSSQPLESLNFINISLDISSAYDSIAVKTYEKSIPDYVLLTEGSISKVMSNVPDWLVGWDTNKVQIGSEYMISPKLFTGKNAGTAEEPILTGIVQGDKCITIDGVERSGIFALVDNEVIFELDPENRKYKFNGEVNATSGVFKNIKSPNDSFRIKENGEIEIVGKISTSSNGTRIEIDPVTNSLKMYTQDGIEVGSLSFFESEWNGIVNYLPRLRLRRYVDNVLYNETSIDSGTIFCSQKVGSDDYSCYLIPSNGLTFYKNNEQTKHYSKS